MYSPNQTTFPPLSDNTSHERLHSKLDQTRGRIRHPLNIPVIQEGTVSIADMARAVEELFSHYREKEFSLEIIPSASSISNPIIDVTPTLSNKDSALQFFDRRLGGIPAELDFYYGIREVENRPPGYVIDLMIVIPDSNRELEYQIYSALRDLTKEYVDLLFNFRIIRRRGRPLNEIIPEGYQRYV